MSGDGGGSSVTIWIGDLKNGGDSAAQHLWERYCDKLMALARRDLRRKLPGGGIGDECDAVNSAFDRFCRGVGTAPTLVWITGMIYGGCWWSSRDGRSPTACATSWPQSEAAAKSSAPEI